MLAALFAAAISAAPAPQIETARLTEAGFKPISELPPGVQVQRVSLREPGQPPFPGVAITRLADGAITATLSAPAGSRSAPLSESAWTRLTALSREAMGPALPERLNPYCQPLLMTLETVLAGVAARREASDCDTPNAQPAIRYNFELLTLALDAFPQCASRSALLEMPPDRLVRCWGAVGPR